MQSERHAMLYQKLKEITDRVEIALVDPDPQELNDLAAQHQQVIVELRQLGFSQDPELLGMVEALRAQVANVMTRLEGHRDALGEVLTSREKQKKRIASYVEVGQRTACRNGLFHGK